MNQLIVVIFGLIGFFGFIGVIYPTPLHKRFKIDKRWKALIVWLVASAIAGPFLPKDHTQNTTAAPAVTQTVQTTQATQTTKPESQPAQEPAQKPKQWTKVIEFSGDQSNSPSDRFQLTGGDVKMEWEIKPDSDLAKEDIIMGGSLNDENNNPVDSFLSNPGQTKGEWKVYGVEAGTYYFKPNSANGKWHAVIYEMK